MTSTPWGFRDILPDEAQAREDIALTVKGCLRSHGYAPVETPLLEDRAALAGGGRLTESPFKLFDDDGRSLMVRPDNTLPIVRLVSTRMRASELPLRLRYEAPVVRASARNSGMSRQFTQLGYELIGTGGVEGDAEIVSIAVETVRLLGLADWKLVCGSVRPFKELLGRCADASLAAQVLDLVHLNNLVDVDVLVRASDEDAAVKRAICELPRLRGGVDALDRAQELLAAAGVDGAAIDDLRDLQAALEQGDPGVAERLSFDFSIMNSFDYYTGLVFKVYAAGMSESVGSGGRYDAVLDDALEGAQHVPAAGFAFSLERLEAVRPTCGQDEHAAVPAAGVDGAIIRDVAAPLRIAVPKGSLNRDALDILERAGLDVSPLRDPGRHLIFRARDTRVGGESIGEVEYIIVRPTDAPAFVACGGADCGICGRDSLIEADYNLLQLVDLGFGACRFIEAEPASAAGAAERAYARRGSLRVATKYPRIASAWYEHRGINADIVTLHGNIELGPIVGMTDRIVDITATGTTLRENDLVITGELMECTARFFVNPGRARIDARVRELAARLAALCEQ